MLKNGSVDRLKIVGAHASESQKFVSLTSLPSFGPFECFRKRIWEWRLVLFAGFKLRPGKQDNRQRAYGRSERKPKSSIQEMTADYLKPTPLDLR